MRPNVEYCNDEGNKQHEKTNRVYYETCGKKQKYTKEDCCKEVEENCHTKYVTGGCARGGSAVHSDHHHGSNDRSLVPSDSLTLSKSKSSHNSQRKNGSARSVKSSKSISSLTQRTSRCYDIKCPTSRDECSNKKLSWQHGRYVHDECGSGIVTKNDNFKLDRRFWCKTPLSMYQASMGELARQILCREIVLPRDTNSEPPSNITEYIFPPCRRYYRKYDCIRPCEEDYAVVKDGKNIYRDRVQRYWEPCLSKEQKHKLNVNEYAPHNVFLSVKLRRKDITDDLQCW